MTALTADRIVATVLADPKAALQALRRATSTYRQRRALARLPDHLIADIGLTRAEAEREAGRDFWDIAKTPR